MQKKFHVLPQTPWAASSFWAIETKSLTVLICSLAILGIGEGLILLSHLGSAPWTVLSQGVALQANVSVGWSSFMISCVVMLFWLPLKLRLGLGTILNIIVIAFFLGLTAEFMPKPTALFNRYFYLSIGILLFGVGSAFYLTCHQGAGPRDGLMVGFCQRFHLKVGIVRTIMEVSVCSLGFLLGGTLGLGTLLFAISIGWVVQITLQLLIKLPAFFHKGNHPS
ncbi:YczE/YyaS/YitT family protein [Pasteurella sp. PK-2025]|uniref:membrane protein YczE n=1 Tax=unclassified Pasteurella TaxID=2621516 RepID=UPI003C709E2A